jgi:hypothetical protein
MTSKEQDTRTPKPSTDKQPVDRSAATQVGQVIQSIGKITERIGTLSGDTARSGNRSGPPASRERIARLIDALGDPQHPDHVSAMDELVEIGGPAVPHLNEAINTRPTWLTAYRAAEALGYIGDGRATGALIQALRHPNSNVRWSAVRALAQIGDLRALFELRRIAAEDHGRTSWGESVAGTAQSALDQMRSRSVWNQSIELVKTAITSVLMILALILAFSVVTTLRGELENIRNVTSLPPELIVALPSPEPEPVGSAPIPTLDADVLPTSTAAPEPTSLPEVTGIVLQGANVRADPSTNNPAIGQVSQGDDIVFEARNPEGDWYRIRLGENHSPASEIANPDGSASGWINQALLSEPDGELPVDESLAGDTTATPTATPAP